MTKPELIKILVEKTEYKKAIVDDVLAAFADTVVEVLSEDSAEKVTLQGLGTFKVKEVPERRGTIQMGERKGEEYVKPAHKEITFKITKDLKDI